MTRGDGDDGGDADDDAENGERGAQGVFAQGVEGEQDFVAEFERACAVLTKPRMARARVVSVCGTGLA